MRGSSVKNARIELVVWDDANVSTEWITLSDAKKKKPTRTYTVGFVAGDNQHGVTLVTDRYPEHPGEGNTPMFIPHGMIVKRVLLAANLDESLAVSSLLSQPPKRRRDSKKNS